MLKVKVEIFRPYRRLIDTYKYAEDKRLSEITQQVNDDIKANLPAIIKAWPDAEELRWEYEGIGQGHYIMIEQSLVKCTECGNTVSMADAMIQSGEYGLRNIVVCNDCFDEQ